MKHIVQKFLLLIILFICSHAYAQHEDMGHSMQGIEPHGMYGGYGMTREASGTSWQPDSTPMQGLHDMNDNRLMMFDGFVNAIYDDQSGRRGKEKTFSTSMLMFMAQEDVDDGTLGFRSMLSLDPAMGKDGYPLLFQTGETGDGVSPLIDRQHPHDLFMELAATYSFALSEKSSVFTYLGLPGEPALGPPTFMHRFSGMDNPAAPITHHWLDSTHITYGVATLGYVWDSWKIEGSSFRGREPDEDRWDIESPKLDSYSARLSFNPEKNWSHQVSLGYIDSPEQLEPDIDVRRYTVSTSYNKPLPNGNWQTMFAWGRNVKSSGKTLDGFILESAAHIADRHILFGRIERVDKDELFGHDDPLHGRTFVVNKVTLGYIYELPAWRHVRFGIGNSLDAGIIPEKLKTVYGDVPISYMIFVRAKLG